MSKLIRTITSLEPKKRTNLMLNLKAFFCEVLKIASKAGTIWHLRLN